MFGVRGRRDRHTQNPKIGLHRARGDQKNTGQCVSGLNAVHLQPFSWSKPAISRFQIVAPASATHRRHTQQSWTHTPQGLVRVPCGSPEDSGTEQARERAWEGVPGGCLGWAGSLGEQRHHKLFLQQPLSLPHSTWVGSGVGRQWEVVGGGGLKEGLLRSGL